jgi:hypothetical protein
LTTAGRDFGEEQSPNSRGSFLNRRAPRRAGELHDRTARLESGVCIGKGFNKEPAARASWRRPRDKVRLGRDNAEVTSDNREILIRFPGGFRPAVRLLRLSTAEKRVGIVVGLGTK